MKYCTKYVRYVLQSIVFYNNIRLMKIIHILVIFQIYTK